MNCIMKCNVIGLVVHLKLNCMVMGSNLDFDRTINFLFINFRFGKKVKGREKPS